MATYSKARIREACRREAVLRKCILENPFIPAEHRIPTPRQAQMLLSDFEEILFGGAGGGGKTDSLLVAALMYVQEPGYSALLLRRTYQQMKLSGSLLDRFGSWMAPWVEKGIVRKEDGIRFRFPSGAVVEFGHLNHEQDKYRYQGPEYDFIGFDELTQFTNTMFSYLWSRLRRPIGSRIPPRIWCASNPGNIGHDWVKAYFGLSGIMEWNVLEVDPSSLKKFHSSKKTITAKQTKRLFICSRIEDNPHVDHESYEEALSRLDPVTWAHMRLGNWDVVEEGDMFKREWFTDAIVTEFPIDSKTNIVRFWDLASTPVSDKNKDPDYSAGVKMAEKDGIYYVVDLKMGRFGVAERDEWRYKIASNEDGHNVMIREEQEPGSSGKTVIYNSSVTMFKEFDYDGIPSTGSKEVRARPLATAAKQGRLKIVSGPWNETFLSYLCAFPQEGVHDDSVDSASGAYAFLSTLSKATVDYSKLNITDDILGEVM